MPPTVTMKELPTASPLAFVATGTPLFNNSAIIDSDPDSDSESDYGSEADEMPLPPKDWRWSTSTFGKAGPLVRHTNIYSDFGSDHEGSDDEEYVAEFQMARHITQFGRSAFNLAPRGAVNMLQQSLSVHSNASRADLSSPSTTRPRQATLQVPHIDTAPRPVLNRSNSSPSSPGPPPLPPKSRLRVSHSFATSPFTPLPITPIAEGELYSPPLPATTFRGGPQYRSDYTEFKSMDSERALTAKGSDHQRLPAHLSSSTFPSSSTFSRSTLSRNTTALSFESAFSKESPLRPRTPSSSLSETIHSPSSSRNEKLIPEGPDYQPLEGGPSSERLFDRHRHALPSLDVMREAKQYVVYDEGCKPSSFGSLYPKMKKNPHGPPPRLIVFFVRVLYCGVCHDYVRESVNTLDRVALDTANVTVIVVTHGNPEGIKGYRKSLNCPFPVYSDPSCGLYSLFNFRDRLAFTKLVCAREHKAKYNQSILPLQMARGFMRTMVHFPRGMGGNVKQLGGEVIIGPGWKCEYIHRTAHPREYMEALDIARVAGCDMPSPEKSKFFSYGNSKQNFSALEAQSPATEDKRPTSRSQRDLAYRWDTSGSSRPQRELSHRRHHSNLEGWRPRPGCRSPDYDDYGNSTRDMTLYRFLAEYLESSERLDRWSGFSTPSPRDFVDNRCDIGMCDIDDLYGNDYQTASGYKAAVQEKYATVAASRREDPFSDHSNSSWI